MFKQTELVEIYSDAKLKMVWDTYTKNVIRFSSLEFAPGSNFILFQDWSYRVEQLRKVILEIGGSLVGVRFPLSWDLEYREVAKRKAKAAGLTILEDPQHPMATNVSFPWMIVMIPKLLYDLMMFKKTDDDGMTISYGTMNRATFDKLKEFTASECIQCFVDSSQFYFSVCSPIETYFTERFYVMAKTRLGLPIHFQANIQVGSLIIYLYLDNSLADGEVRDLKDDIIVKQDE